MFCRFENVDTNWVLYETLQKSDTKLKSAISYRIVSYTMDADYKTHFGNNIKRVLYPNKLY